MRPWQTGISAHQQWRFNLRREAAPHATLSQFVLPYRKAKFQSQTRSRSTCDKKKGITLTKNGDVSISDEKPLHMRPCIDGPDTREMKAFQSQTRSRSTCDS